MTPRTTEDLAAIAACVALSNPLVTPTLTLFGIDIDAIVQHAFHLGTAPAVIHNLISLGHKSALPNLALQLLDHTLAQNIVAMDESTRAAAHLERAGIRAMPIKGLAFLLDLYSHNVGLRRMVDVDILIDQDSFVNAESCLLHLGWRREFPNPIASRWGVEAHFYKDLGGLSIHMEIHRRLTFPGRFLFSPERLWRDARTTNALPSWRLSHEDALIHLATHKLGHHYRNDIRDLIDAHNLLAAFPIDWALLTLKAEQYGASTALWLFLSRVKYFGANLPEPLLQQLAPNNLRAWGLGRLMRDAVLESDFRQCKPGDVPLTQRLSAIGLGNDKVAAELFALNIIALRQLTEKLLPLNALPSLLPLFDKLPLPDALSPFKHPRG